MPNSQHPRPRERTTLCKWCGQTFTTLQHNHKTCDSLLCKNLNQRLYKLKKRLGSHPELLALLEERSKELSQKVSSPTFELRGRIFELWNLLFNELRDKRKELRPLQRTYGQTHCKWCGEEFTRKSWHSQTCHSPECRKYKFRHKKLQYQLKPYPKALKSYEKRADYITSIALKGMATTHRLWYELFQDSATLLKKLRKEKKNA